jgi:pimeloyl-ACP methyl ester carboxylesterase
VSSRGRRNRSEAEPLPFGGLHQIVIEPWQRQRTNIRRLALHWGSAFWVFSMRALLFFVALLCGVPSFAASRCDLQVPTAMADVGEVRLAYQSIGRDSDPPLLLVMGLGGQLIHWPDEVLVRLCQQGFRVIRFDNRDVGLSTWAGAVPEVNLGYELLSYQLGLGAAAPYSLRDMAGDALGLMDVLGAQRFHVLGASMGGMIAQHMADLAPQRVESLTLLMTSSSAPGLPAPDARLLEQLARREASDRAAAIEQQADLLAALGSPSQENDREQLLAEAERSYDRAFNPQGVQRQILAILAEPSRVELLNRLQVPTLVVHGTADPLLPAMHGVHLAAHIKGSELKLIPGLAHRFQAAFKEPLLAAVLPHLRAHCMDDAQLALRQGSGVQSPL